MQNNCKLQTQLQNAIAAAKYAAGAQRILQLQVQFCR
jgi:hypothetical protein